MQTHICACILFFLVRCGVEKQLAMGKETSTRCGKKQAPKSTPNPLCTWGDVNLLNNVASRRPRLCSQADPVAAAKTPDAKDNIVDYYSLLSVSPKATTAQIEQVARATGAAKPICGGGRHETARRAGCYVFLII